MTGPAGNGRELCSWKEIAAYLGVSVRTAQLWERQRGLPVHRLPGGAGARVVAWTAQLDEWKLAPPPQAEASPVPVSRRRLFWYGGAALVAAAPVYIAARRSRPQPSSWRVEGRSLVMLDEHGRPMWTHLFDVRVQDRLPYPVYTSSRGLLADMDGDGRVEFLFAKSPAEETESRPSLLCFSDSGRVKWEFSPGKPVATRRETFTPVYGVAAFAIGDLGGDQGKGVVVSSTHHPYYPAQVTLLSPEGKIRGEYWHSGHLNAVRIGDVDGDGRVEIALGGVNNAANRATLILLDPSNFGGASVERNPDYQILNFPVAREKRRVLFPRSCVNRATHLRNQAYNLLSQPGRLTVDVMEALGNPDWGALSYIFGPKLALETVEFHDSYRIVHEKLERQRLLDHPLTREEMEHYRQAVQFLP